MGGWWIAFWDKWSREDPMLLMNFVSLVFTVLIPITLWWLGRKQAKRDSLLVEQQTIILERQDKIMRRQRRDALLESITRSSDATYLGILWGRFASLLSMRGRIGNSFSLDSALIQLSRFPERPPESGCRMTLLMPS